MSQSSHTLIVSLVLLSTCLLNNTSASAQDDVAWSPKDVPVEVLQSIINGNLFVPNQRRTPRVEPPPGENDGEQSEAEEPVDRPAPEPEDPDRAYRFIGSSFIGEQALAFIENMRTNEIHRVPLDEAFSVGQIVSIDYNRIDYKVDEATRSILIGRDLTGAEPSGSLESELSNLFAPTTTTQSTSSSDTRSERPKPTNKDAASGSDSQADILRRMRERRERESQ